MLRLIRWIFTGDGHAHHWKIIDTFDVKERDRDLGRSGIVYVLQCDHCGKVKRSRINP